MAKGTAVFNVKTKCSIGGEDRAPGSIRITYSVNSYGQCSTTHYNKSNPKAHEKAIELTSKDVYQDMGKRQNLIFTERSEPDYKVTIESKREGGSSDEGGGKVKFEGFISAPAYTFNTSNVSMSDTGVDKLARLEVMNLSVYDRVSVSRTQAEVSLEDNGYNIPRYVSAFVEKLVDEKNLSVRISGASDDFDTKAVKSQHELNKKVLPIFKKLMEDSEKTWGWDDILSGSRGICDAAIAQHMMNTLAATSGSFISSLLTFATGYKNFLVPELDDESGEVTYRFYSAIEVVNKEPERLKVNPVSSGITAGNTTGLFPIRYVAVCRDTVKGSRSGNHEAGEIMAVYPMENMKDGGTPVRDMGAPWMPEVFTPYFVDKSGGEPPREQFPKKGQVRQEKTEAEKNIEEGITMGSKVDLEWAKLSYYWMALGTSTVTLSLPFTRVISVGKRYTVYNTKDSLLFTGFCSRVNYSINTQGSRAATITAEFTHVELPGFNLVR